MGAGFGLGSLGKRCCGCGCLFLLLFESRFGLFFGDNGGECFAGFFMATVEGHRLRRIQVVFLKGKKKKKTNKQLNEDNG